MTGIANKFPGIVQFPQDVALAKIGMAVYMFLTAIIYDKMGVSGLENGAITGALFGSAKWFTETLNWLILCLQYGEIGTTLLLIWF